MNRKNAAREQEEQINTFSRRTKRDEKMLLWRGMTTKSMRYDPAKLDN